MKFIIISGPSGSGKTTLSKKLIEKLNNGLIINTDNYYKTGFVSRILSIFIDSYFDRLISLNFKLVMEDISNIIKNKYSKHSYTYDYKKKCLAKNKEVIKNIQFIIVEGIFAEEILNSLSTNSLIFIKLKTAQKTCMNRVIKRDILERGKKKENANNDFLKSWKLFHKKEKNYEPRKNIVNLVFTNKPNINFILKNIINLDS